MLPQNSKNSSIARGMSDSTMSEPPADGLGIGKYVNAVAGFIRTCETPLTLAVQGDWGFGKTTTMLIVEEQLHPTAKLSDSSVKKDKHSLSADQGKMVGPPLYTIRFNTWQCSQFNFGSFIALSMMNTILTELSQVLGSGLSGQIKRKGKQFLDLLINTGSKLVGGNSLDLFDEVVV